MSSKKYPKTVQSQLFVDSDFFQPQDRAQIKYEMLRAHCHDKRFVTRVCREFGYCRESFYQALETFRKEGLAGLVEKPKGKTKPDKLTPEIIGYVIYQRAKFHLSGAAIADLILDEFEVKLHKRTVERILGHYGILNR
jgi:transposase-like protein